MRSRPFGRRHLRIRSTASTGEAASIKRRLAALQRRGFYENYLAINRLNNELKKIESRIETLRMREASGADLDLLMKIERLERDFAVEYRVHLVSF